MKNLNRRLKMSEIIITDDDMRVLKNHYYNERPYTTDAMLDLWHDTVKQIVNAE